MPRSLHGGRQERTRQIAPSRRRLAPEVLRVGGAEHHESLRPLEYHSRMDAPRLDLVLVRFVIGSAIGAAAWLMTVLNHVDGRPALLLAVIGFVTGGAVAGTSLRPSLGGAVGLAWRSLSGIRGESYFQAPLPLCHCSCLPASSDSVRPDFVCGLWRAASPASWSEAV
jgi:hypothetical protein